MKIGQTIENGTIRVHRYQNQVVVTDLTNAGKRGKKVDSFSASILHGDYDAAMQRRLDRVSSTMAEQTNYGTALGIVEDYIARFPRELNIYRRQERGIDVRPGGVEKILAFNALGIELEADPLDFRMVHREAMGRSSSAANEQGDAFYQDTAYWPVKKADARKFYDWLLANRSKIDSMSVRDFGRVFNQLGIQYHSH